MKKKNNKHIGRITAFLTREQLDFIEKIGKDALYTTGKRLSHSEVTRAIIETVRKLNINGADTSTEDELTQKMLEVSKKGLLSLAEELRKQQKQEPERKPAEEFLSQKEGD